MVRLGVQVEHFPVHAVIVRIVKSNVRLLHAHPLKPYMQVT